ncbi:hypothetical protein JTE90_019890 [Oedothorax gibbosus]|uniref:PH domain-containing protein n=1 Tax=Oedothorax gibbosus TaxID=931172 RepID=A0AAV6VWD6_9ARAC|nr:hypothetical protein JTE90_019890 [Oedothorax gibbosus]
MDLDDSFTEKLLRRAKARKEYLTTKKTESPIICSKKRPVLSEESQILSEDLEDVATDESPKRQRLSLPSEDNEYEKENVVMDDIEEEEAFVPYKAAANRGLAALKNKHNGDSIESNHGSSTKENYPQTYTFSTPSTELCSGGRKTRLANLAANINQWEDDSNHPTNNVVLSKKPASNSHNYSTTSSSSSSGSKSSVSETHSVESKSFVFKNNSHNCDSKSSVSKTNSTDWKSSVLKNSSRETDIQISSSGAKSTFVFGESERPRVPPVSSKDDIVSGVGGNSGIAKKIGVWEQAVQAALETHANVKSPMKASVNVQSNIEPERESSDEESYEEEDEKEFDNNNFRQEEPKLNNKHMFENVQKNENLDKSFEPTDLPLSARKALFEKALLCGNTQPSMPPEKLSVAQKAKMFETATKTNTKPKLPSNFVAPKSSSPMKSTKTVQVHQSPSKAVVASVPKSSPIKKLTHTNQVQQQQSVKNVANNLHPKEAAGNVVGEKKEISSLVNHWENLVQKEEQIKRENARKYQNSDEMYESEEELEDQQEDSVSDLESEHHDQESEINYNDQEETVDPIDESQSDHDISDSEQEVFNSNKFTAEASLTNFDIDTDYTTDNDAGSLYGRPNSNYDSMSSESISMKSSTSEPQSYSVTKSQTSSTGSSTSSYRASDLNEEVFQRPSSVSIESPLCHTVSFYRKQKQVVRTPPKQTIVRREPIAEEDMEDEDQTEMIQERIRMLQEENVRHEAVISQTSQALNLCVATAEFSGSTEQVEGERLLLIATQKRQACLNEIQRLKSHGAQGQVIAEGSGTLTISDIQLPLKQTFIAAQLEGKINDAVHYFLCLIRHGSQVIVTQMVSTADKVSDGTLHFTNHIKLQKLPSDFSVVFEVYGLQTKKEVLPHDKKYHIKKEKGTLTPKKKKGDAKLLFPGISSPGGPHAVRSPSFSVIGYTRFTIQNHNKKIFTLDKVPFSSPLEGVLKVHLHLHAEHKVVEKGFLTMFEDVSGFGAWHRRWCSLDSRHLSFWKYPDDEAKKEPIGVIDLRQCVTAQVKLVSRDVCARPHTFQLLTVRPPARGDKNTLVSQKLDTLTSTKHLISADTKEERITWCNKLNEALTNLRKWDPKALRPIEEKQE